MFGQVEVERWDAPLVRLPDRDAVRDYLIARFVVPEDAAAAAERVATPVAITKRGALIYARKDSSAPVSGGEHRGHDAPGASAGARLT